MHCYGKMRTEHIFRKRGIERVSVSRLKQLRSYVPYIDRVGTDYKAHAPTKSGQYIKLISYLKE